MELKKYTPSPLPPNTLVRPPSGAGQVLIITSLGHTANSSLADRGGSSI